MCLQDRSSKISPIANKSQPLGEAEDYGAIDDQGNFQPMTEAEMAAQSLKVLQDYQQNRDGVSHDRVSEWLNSIGMDSFDEDAVVLQVRHRASTPVTLSVPDDVLASLQQVAIDREMSLERLLKLYIGKGLRNDRTRK